MFFVAFNRALSLCPLLSRFLPLFLHVSVSCNVSLGVFRLFCLHRSLCVSCLSLFFGSLSLCLSCFCRSFLYSSLGGVHQLMQFPAYFLIPLVVGIPAVAGTLKVSTDTAA